MRRIVCFLQLMVIIRANHLYHPFEQVLPLGYPYYDVNPGYTYAPQVQTYNSYIPTYTHEYVHDYAARIGGGYLTIPEVQPTINVMAEIPYSVSKEFSVVPLFVVAKDTMNVVSQGHITSVSQHEPIMTVKVANNKLVKCTPAVRMVLDKPITVGSLKSNVLFPSEVQIIHEGARIPMKIGAVIAPVVPQTYVSQETPISVRVVYAIPTKPLKITITIEQEDGKPTAPQSSNRKPVKAPSAQRIPVGSKKQNKNKQPQKCPCETSTQQSPGPSRDQASQSQPATPDEAPFGALNNRPPFVSVAGVAVVPDQETVVVESEEELPPKNITVIEFPTQEAEPNLQVDEEDEELVNRNPPALLAPAGIVQSTQPLTHVEPFHNDKESPYLDSLREEAKKKRI